MHYKVCVFLITLISICSSDTVFGQTVNKFDFERIEDNSFLLEEAYNQEPGVIQHISAFQYLKDKTWVYTFTEEWPVPGQKHQVSATIPLLNNSETGIGDIAINYRYQAIFQSRLAFSPRFSILIPSGNYRRGLGSGVPGYQADLPVSFILSSRFVSHYNAGITLIPGSRNNDGFRSDVINYNYGLSLIMLVNSTFNLMLEAAGNKTTAKGNNYLKRSNTLIINPGFRYAFNFESGLQIVPGFSVPVGIGPSNGISGVFLYLSFEHPAWKPK